jgi:hypothetical protein
MTDASASHPSTMESQLKELDRRLRGLEGSSQLRNSAIRDGSMQLQDAAGKPIVVLGKQADGSYGIAVSDATGVVLFKADSLGIATPAPAPMRSEVPVTVTSAAFVNIGTCALEMLATDAVRIRSTVTVDAATAGEIRLANVSAGTFTNAIALPAGFNGFAEFRWLHGLPIGNLGPFYFRLQARRTSGAGNVNVYPSDGGLVQQRGALMVPAATTTGV